MHFPHCIVCLGSLLLFLLPKASLMAQQIPQYALYALNPYAYNPAFAGNEGTLVATGVYRRQWSGLDGSPETQHINAHMPVPFLSSGVGIKIENDIIGAHRVTQAGFAYNYQIGIGQNGQLALGAGMGYLQYSLDGTRLRTPEGLYPTTGTGFSHNDPRLPEGIVKAGTFVAEAGVRMTFKKWEAGIATQPVFAPLLSTGSTDSRNAFQIKAVRHYILHLGGRFAFGEQITVRPVVLVKSDLAGTQTEAHILFKWREQFLIGGGYRGFLRNAQESAALIAGIRLNEKTQLAYGFDMPLGPLSGTQRGSHELLIKYSLQHPVGTGKLPPVIYNPRFF